MRKWIAALLALLMLISAAFAENADELMALDYEDFTIAVPKDAVGAGTDTIENNVPFLTIYQNYNPNDFIGSSLSIVWGEEVLNLAEVDPAAYCQAVAMMTMQRYESVGIVVTEPRIYTAELDEMDERPALSYIFSMVLDFTALGLKKQETVHTLQATVPIEGNGTYTFTITTNDLANSQELLDIVDSVRWK